MFAPVLAWTVLVIATLVAFITWVGRERKGADLSSTAFTDAELRERVA
jgi:hypothetical protein